MILQSYDDGRGKGIESAAQIDERAEGEEGPLEASKDRGSDKCDDRAGNNEEEAVVAKVAGGGEEDRGGGVQSGDAEDGIV